MRLIHWEATGRDPVRGFLPSSFPPRGSKEEEEIGTVAMEDGVLCQWSVFRSLLAIVQWWGFNVTVIIMNKWIFQVRGSPNSPLRSLAFDLPCFFLFSLVKNPLFAPAGSSFESASVSCCDFVVCEIWRCHEFNFGRFRLLWNSCFDSHLAVWVGRLWLSRFFG